MTLEEKAAHAYRTDVETINNFVMAFFSASTPESGNIIIEEFLELHVGKVCEQTVYDIFSFLEEYARRYLI